MSGLTVYSCNPKKQGKRNCPETREKWGPRGMKYWTPWSLHSTNHESIKLNSHYTLRSFGASLNTFWIPKVVAVHCCSTPALHLLSPPFPSLSFKVSSFLGFVGKSQRGKMEQQQRNQRVIAQESEETEEIQHGPLPVEQLQVRSSNLTSFSGLRWNSPFGFSFVPYKIGVFFLLSWNSWVISCFFKFSAILLILRNWFSCMWLFLS